MTKIKYLAITLPVFILSAAVFAQDDLGVGETLTVDPAAGDSTTFTFEAEVETAVNLYAVSTADEDIRIMLYDSNGGEVARDDDSGDALNPNLRRFELPETDTYTVEVFQPYEDVAPLSAFDITLEETTILSLDEGEQSVVLGNSQTLEVFSYEVEADTSYMLTVLTDEPAQWFMFVNLFSEGEFTLSDHQFTGSKFDGMAFFFTPAESGTMRIVVDYTDFMGGEIEFTVAAEPVE